MLTSNHSKILLLQIRDNPEVRQEEISSFCEFGGIATERLDVLNVFDTPSFEPNVIDGYAALIIGGASEASVLEPETYRFLDPSYRLVRYCLEKDIPTFASCFGFQLAVMAMGGTIVRDAKDFEIGTVPIQLTSAAKDDVLMANLPDPFMAVSVHRERAPDLPEQCELLAFTDKCPHAFKVKNKPFWGFQFHPEVDKQVLIQRLSVFKEHYTENHDHFQKVIDSAEETPESNALIRNFINFVR